MGAEGVRGCCWVTQRLLNKSGRANRTVEKQTHDEEDPFSRWSQLSRNVRSCALWRNVTALALPLCFYVESGAAQQNRTVPLAMRSAQNCQRALLNDFHIRFFHNQLDSSCAKLRKLAGNENWTGSFHHKALSPTHVAHFWHWTKDHLCNWTGLPAEQIEHLSWTPGGPAKVQNQLGPYYVFLSSYLVVQ